MVIKKYFKNFCTKKNFENFKKIDQEISAQDKYKDFTIDNLKKYEQVKRQEDKYFTQKYEEYSSKGPFEVRKIAKELINRNFLRPKKIENLKPEFNFDIETLKAIDKPIMIYEINENIAFSIARTHNLFYKYFRTALLINIGIFLPADLFFIYNNYCYFMLYTVNILTYIAFMNNYNVRKSWVVEFEYNHKEQNVRIKLMKTYKSAFYDKTHNVNELELCEDRKLFQTGMVLKVKNTYQVYIFDDDNIWYQKDLFYHLFKR